MSRFRFKIVNLLIAFLFVTQVYGQTYDSNPKPPAIVQFSTECMRQLGITDLSKHKQWLNCLDGEHIPITIGGKPLNQSNSKNAKTDCDIRTAANGSCDSFAFLTKINFSKDVVGYLLCRQEEAFYLDKQGRENWLSRAKTDNEKEQRFNLLYGSFVGALIVSNTSNGKTCFFDSTLNYARFVPMPWISSPLKDVSFPNPVSLSKDPNFEKNKWKISAKHIWKNPFNLKAENCTQCHTIPFISSQWIQQVPNHPFSPQHSDPKLPYVPLGKGVLPWAFEEFISINTTPVMNPINGKFEPQACTSCHRITGQKPPEPGSMINYNLQRFIKFSTGEMEGQVLNPYSSATKRKFWMPDGHGISSDEKWKATYQHHVDKLLCCIKDYRRKGCLIQTIGGTVGGWKAGNETPGCDPVTPSPTPTETPTSDPTTIPTATPTKTIPPQPTKISSPTPTNTATKTPSNITPTATPTITPIPDSACLKKLGVGWSQRGGESCNALLTGCEENTKCTGPDMSSKSCLDAEVNCKSRGGQMVWDYDEELNCRGHFHYGCSTPVCSRPCLTIAGICCKKD